METSPVKGHFLSVVLVLDMCFYYSNPQGSIQRLVVPMYEPSIAVFGVLKPKPTSLYHLRPPLPTFVLLVRFVFWLTKMWGCFWKARSDCTVNSVAMAAV